jgi:hypothetical protein
MDVVEGDRSVLPRARKDHLTIRVLPEETLIYDQERHKAHCLNAPAALVWRHCDGKTTIADLCRILTRDMGIESEEIVGLALEQLARRHLLEEAPGPLPATERLSRREVLKKLAVVAVTLPIIMTITTRTAAQTLSETNNSDPPSSDSQPPINLQVAVQTGSNSSSSSSSPGKPNPPSRAPSSSPSTTPCRMKGQSCVAAMSGQQGTCCSGLTCTGVVMNAGVCG